MRTVYDDNELTSLSATTEGSSGRRKVNPIQGTTQSQSKVCESKKKKGKKDMRKTHLDEEKNLKILL
jgi:hypothetical protein